MKQNLAKKILLPAILLISSSSIVGLSSARAADEVTSPESKQTLAEYVESEILSLDKALKADISSPTIIADDGKEDAYFFRRFWLRLRPRVERDIPWLAGFSVIPELELLFEKPTPEGWDIYKIEKKK